MTKCSSCKQEGHNKNNKICVNHATYIKPSKCVCKGNKNNWNCCFYCDAKYCDWGCCEEEEWFYDKKKEGWECPNCYDGISDSESDSYSDSDSEDNGEEEESDDKIEKVLCND